MHPPATTLVVFGRGVDPRDGRYTLTPGGLARLDAVAQYVAGNEAAFTRAGRTPRIVFSGGWAEACAGADPPPAGHREGDLMLAWARTAGLDRYAELVAETRSRSTLENLLHVVEDGLLAGREFTAGEPLGLVSHHWHLPRIRYLAGKVLRLRGPALLDVQARGGEVPVPWRFERAVHAASRLGFLGTSDAAALLRRERRLVASLRRAEHVARSWRPGGTRARTG